jgi:hypothetical protein
MATVLFWNINQKDLLEDIVFLCQDYDVDILILAESKLSDVNVLESLNCGTNGLYISPFNPSSRLSFFFRYSPEVIRLVADDGGVAIRELSPPLGDSFLLVGLHLPSKRHLSDSEQMFHAVRVAQAIQEAETRVGHSRTLAIGDFNMNPFEPGVVSADGFHAVMDRRIALKRSRQVQGQDKPFFYNPMWGLMGDASPGAAGTYYYSSGGYINYFWNTFDQVLLRPDLLDCLTQGNLQVIDAVRGKSLLAQNGLIKAASDHLPILVKLNIERTVSYG